MEEKLRELGLNLDTIKAKYDLDEYEKIVKFYLEDEFFNEIKTYLENEDYALAKDATKGLYILAQDLYLYDLYIGLMEIYEDLESKLYNDVLNHYDEMYKEYERLKGAFNV